METTQAQLQEEEYDYPYHYIPAFLEDGVGSNVRYLRWGYEYLCYLKHIAEVVSDLRPASVLDVGCGDGRLFSLLRLQGEARLLGVDFSARPLDYARAFNPTAEFRAVGVAEIDELFDLVTAVEVLEHVPDGGVVTFLEDLATRVRPGGHVLLSVPTAVMPVAPKHYRHYTRELLEQQVGESGIAVEWVSVEHVYRQSRLVDAVTRLTMNRAICCEISTLRRWLWGYTWRRLRQAGAASGRHLVAVLRKTSEPVS